MLIEYVDAWWFNLLLILSGGICLLYSFRMCVLVVFIKNETKTGNLKGRNQKRKKEETNYRNKIEDFLIVIMITVIIWGYLAYEKKEYRVIEQFYDLNNVEENVGEHIFKKVEREYVGEQEWAEIIIHKDLYEECFDIESENITIDDIESYRDWIWNIYLERPFKEDILIDLKKAGNSEIDIKKEEEFDRLYAVFKEAVNDELSDWKASDLWEAYEAGKEISKINYTSEMIFQTGVLAEGAHENIFRENYYDKNSLIYLAGATEQFEKFLTFKIRDAGNDNFISEAEVSFRQGKMDYREGTKRKDMDEKDARHFLLKAYAEFQYILEQVTIEDELYPPALYYSGLVILRMMSYIDIEERNEICKKELERWEFLLEYYEKNTAMIKVEGKSFIEIIEIRDDLLMYTKDM